MSCTLNSHALVNKVILGRKTSVLSPYSESGNLPIKINISMGSQKHELNLDPAAKQLCFSGKRGGEISNPPNHPPTPSRASLSFQAEKSSSLISEGGAALLLQLSVCLSSLSVRQPSASPLPTSLPGMVAQVKQNYGPGATWGPSGFFTWPTELEERTLSKYVLK